MTAAAPADDADVDDVARVSGSTLGISYALSGPAAAISRLADLLPPAADARPPRLLLCVVPARAAVERPADPRPPGTRTLVSVHWLDGTAPERLIEAATDDEGEALLAALNETVLRWCEDLTLHAGVMLGGDGAVAFPGASGLGKTTLVGACLRRGLALLSDEALRLTPDGQALAYPRPLALDARSAALLGLPAPLDGRELLLRPDALGPLAPPGPHPLAAVLLLERRPGPVRLRPATAGEAVHAMLTRSFNHFRDPARAVGSVTAAVAGAERLHVGYEDARSLADVLCERHGVPR